MSAQHSSVVSLSAHARKQVTDHDLHDIVQPIGQITLARILMRKWSVLPDQEFKVISVIFGAVTAWGKASRKLTYRFLEFGDNEHVGTGHGKRNLMRIIASLEERKVLFVDRSDVQTGLGFTINFRWTPEESMLPVPKHLQKGAEFVTRTEELTDGWADTSDNTDTTPVTALTSPPCQASHHIKAGYFKQDTLKHDKVSPASPSRDTAGLSASLEIDPASSWVTEPAARPEDFSSTPIARPPSSTTVDDVMAPVRERDRKLRDKAEKVLKPGSLEITFRAEFAQHFANQPGALFATWMPKDMGMVKNMFIKRWTGTVQEAHDFVRWSVANWQAIMSRPCFSWMTKPRPPEFPELGFWLRHHANFLVEMGRDATERWISDMKDFEEREFHRLTVKENMSEAAARMKIAEDRAARKMRDENMKATQAANEAWQKARLVEDRIKKFGQDREPHPRSRAAEEARRAAAAQQAEDYRKEHKIQPLGDNDPIPDLIAAAEIGWQNADWNN